MDEIDLTTKESLEEDKFKTMAEATQLPITNNDIMKFRIECDHAHDIEIQNTEVAKSRHTFLIVAVISVWVAFIINEIVGLEKVNTTQKTNRITECIKNGGTVIGDNCTQMKVNILPQVQQEE